MQTDDTPCDRNDPNSDALSAETRPTSTFADGESDMGPLFFASWVGTVAAGSLFGALTGGIAGLVVGGILAGIVGAPVHITVAAAMHLLWLTKHSLPMAASAGAVTGIAATALIWEPFRLVTLGTSITLLATIAAIFGALGGALGGASAVSPKQQRVHSHRCRANRSLLEVLLRFIVVAGMVAGWCWLAISIYKAQMPITVAVAELQSRFGEHEAEFKRVATMAKEDKGFDIFGDGSYDDEVLGLERRDEYLAVLSKAGLVGNRISSQHQNGNHKVEISPSDGFRHGIAMKYLYTNVEPERVVVGFEERDTLSIGPGEVIHVGIGHDWYVAIERPEHSD